MLNFGNTPDITKLNQAALNVIAMLTSGYLSDLFPTLCDKKEPNPFSASLLSLLLRLVMVQQANAFFNLLNVLFNPHQSCFDLLGI